MSTNALSRLGCIGLGSWLAQLVLIGTIGLASFAQAEVAGDECRVRTGDRPSVGLVLGGGVAANRGLRARAQQVCVSKGLTLHVPPFASSSSSMFIQSLAFDGR